MPEDNERSLRNELIRVARIVTEQGLLRSSDGNISARLDRSLVLITPSGVYKKSMSPEDLIIIDMDGKIVRARKALQPTTETLMHLEVYRRRPDVNAVIHAHPPFSTALTIAEKPFPVEYVPEVLIALGEVPTAAYATPGTQGMADSIHELILEHNCILLSHHGSLNVGSTLEEALIALERMEYTAYTFWISLAFGSPMALSVENLEKLRQIGKRIQVK